MADLLVGTRASVPLTTALGVLVVITRYGLPLVAVERIGDLRVAVASVAAGARPLAEGDLHRILASVADADQRHGLTRAQPPQRAEEVLDGADGGAAECGDDVTGREPRARSGAALDDVQG